MNTLVCEQRKELSQLAHDLQQRANIEGPLTQDEIESLENESYDYIMVDNFCVKRQKIIEAIDEEGQFVQLEMDKLKESEENREVYESIVLTIANFLLQLVVGISKVVAERDSQNSPADELPPVLPLDLCHVAPREFISHLKQQILRLKQKFTDEEIEKIDQQFRDLRIAFREQDGLQQSLKEAHSQFAVSSFPSCWSPLGSKFNELRQYAGGIATVMPGTSCVESDFSLIKWTKDPNSRSLTDFSLESILHCKQYGQLEELFE
jgi:hypothetical protein